MPVGPLRLRMEHRSVTKGALEPKPAWNNVYVLRRNEKSLARLTAIGGAEGMEKGGGRCAAHFDVPREFVTIRIALFHDFREKESALHAKSDSQIR